jgi:hypothetical protein
MVINRSAILALAALLCGPALLCAPARVCAESRDPLSNRLSGSFGTFLLTTDTQIRVDGETGRGTQFDAERELGLDDADRFRFDGYWRFANRHKLRAMYFDTNRKATRTIDRDLQLGDTVFPLNAEVSASHETKVAKLSYEYAFLRRENYELAAALGVHNLQFDLKVSSLRGQGEQTLIERRADANGPLPVFGLNGVYRFNEHLYVEAMAQYFKISLDPYDGRLEDYTLSLVWMPFAHVGIGAGYNHFVTRVEVDADQFMGDLRWRYGGARIFLVATF